jgi:uncharacterized protein DUF5681
MKWQKGQSGNPLGRPRGSFGLASMLAAAELTADAAAIIRSTIEVAKKGNVGAQRICWQRLDPVPKNEPALCDLPALTQPSDSSRVVAAIVAAAAAGEITTQQATELAGLVETYVRMRYRTGAPEEAGGPEPAALAPPSLAPPVGNLELQEIPCGQPPPAPVIS